MKLQLLAAPIAFNKALDQVTANKIIENQFVEVLIAPGIEPEAQKVIAEIQKRT